MDEGAVAEVLRRNPMLEGYAESFENSFVTGQFLLNLVKEEHAGLFQEFVTAKNLEGAHIVALKLMCKTETGNKRTGPNGPKRKKKKKQKTRKTFNSKNTTLANDDVVDVVENVVANPAVRTVDQATFLSQFTGAKEQDASVTLGKASTGLKNFLNDPTFVTKRLGTGFRYKAVENDTKFKFLFSKEALKSYATLRKKARKMGRRS